MTLILCCVNSSKRSLKLKDYGNVTVFEVKTQSAYILRFFLFLITIEQSEIQIIGRHHVISNTRLWPFNKQPTSQPLSER